jgi:hypothetical protein
MEQNFSIEDIVLITLFLGSLTFLIGLAYQLFVCIKSDKRIQLKHFLIVLVTRFLTVSLTLFIWSRWITKIDIQFGLIFLPAFLSEVILSPILLIIFGYKIWVSKK